VDSAAIQADAVTSGKVAPDTLDATDLAANSVGASELADNAVDSAAIAADTILAVDIATDAVGAVELAPDAVTASGLANDSVDSAAIINGAVGDADIRPGGTPSTVSINPPSVAANSCSTVNTAVASIAVGDFVLMNLDPALETGLDMEAANQDTAGQLRVRVCNHTGSAIDGVARTHNLLVIR
jgi:hypothetical protein